jgi:very-short-patch-repair endonuclease
MANARARALRKRLTLNEERLWKELRELRRQGVHFRRQVPIDHLIVDFACFRRRLVIEVDGVQHHTAEGRWHDAARDAHLAWRGFKVRRFTNGEVTETLEGVIREIMAEVGLVEGRR